MRGAAIWTLVGMLGISVQAMLAAVFPVALVPDLALLAAFAAALALPPSHGLVVVCLLGFGADMVSGSLLGQHAFVRVLEFLFVRAVAGQLDLRRAVPQLFVAFALSVIDSALMAGLTLVFVPAFPVAWAEVGGLLGRAAATAVLAPVVCSAAGSLSEGMSALEGRREMRLETRRPVL